MLLLLMVNVHIYIYMNIHLSLYIYIYIPSTTKTIIFVGFHYTALYRNFEETYKIMDLVVEDEDVSIYIYIYYAKQLHDLSLSRAQVNCQTRPNALMWSKSCMTQYIL